MNIEDWIEENTDWLVDEEDIQVVPVSELRELLKTHAIVPREPSDEIKEVMLTNQSNLFSAQGGIYKKIIKAAEEE